jgi:glycosyltransferase involved in cell wall biosynthesis
LKALIALIPAHNESRTITGVVCTARKHLPVLVVDDGSIDDTANRAKAAGAVVIRQTPNQGKGAALRTGFKYALKRGYQAVITLDGDGQHDPAEISSFITAWQKQPVGLIIGQREFSRMPLIRRLANTLGGNLFSLSVGHRVADNQSGYRLIDRKLMEFMLEDDEPGFELEVDMVVLALKRHLGLAWVPIRTIYTGGPSHIKPLPHLYNFLRVCFKAHRAMRSN